MLFFEKKFKYIKLLIIVLCFNKSFADENKNECTENVKMHTREHIKIGCEIFIVQDGALLLGKRKNCYGAGDWGLPGGHLEYGETLREGAIRELKEELGINARDLELCTVVDDIENNGGHYIHMSFVLNSYEGNISLKEPDKCYEWRFFPLGSLPENIFSAHRKIVEVFFKKDYTAPAVYPPSGI